MKHPPTVAGAVTLLLALAGALLVPSAAHAQTDEDLGAFHARMLDLHGGVYVEEELTGIFDRQELARELHAQVDGYGAQLDVLVVARAGGDTGLRQLARNAADHRETAVVVFSPDSNAVGAAQLDGVGLPRNAVDYVFYTGAFPEDPRAQLARLLRAADHPRLEERTMAAEVEYAERVDGYRLPSGQQFASPGFPTQRWWGVTWPETAGLVTGVLVSWVVAGLARVLWVRRRSGGAGAPT